MNRGLEPWIRKWWTVANERRYRLIVKKHKQSLTPAEIREYELLQEVADAILSYVGKKNPMKTFNLVCLDCKEPVEFLDALSFLAHNCHAHKAKVVPQKGNQT